MTEYLTKNSSGNYQLVNHRFNEDDIEVPEGAEIAIKFNDDPEGYGIIFYKNDGKTSAASDNGFLWKSGSLWSMRELLDPDFKDGDIDLSHVILWQRNSLQEKINETLSALNVNKAQLSILLGREKSYVKRLLAKGRNVTENTKAAVIDQLEQLIRVHEYEQLEPAQIDHEAIIAKLNLQLHTTSKLLDQAVAEKNVWRLKLQDQRNLSWFLTLVVVVMAFVWIYSVCGV